MHDTRDCHVRAICRDGWLGGVELSWESDDAVFGVTLQRQAQALPLSQSLLLALEDIYTE